MNKWRLITRSLVFHWRSHAGALLGAAIGTAVLTGALAVGDSVRSSLRRMAIERLGKVDLALAANDRFFREELAADLAGALSTNGARRRAAPVVQVSGTASASDGTARANKVQVLGIDRRFWDLATTAPQSTEMAEDEIFINEMLASQLRVRSGDAVLLRVEKPSQLSRDAPLSPEEESTTALRATVRQVVGDEQFGRFSLQANQVAPFNAYLPLERLQKRLNLTNRANLLLISAQPAETGKRPQEPMEQVAVEEATGALRRVWQLADAELELRPVRAGGNIELRSRRVFIDPAVAARVTEIHPTARGVLTYLVNELRRDQRTTPYSMVTATDPPVAPVALADDEIAINTWLAEDLQAKPGDELRLTYFVVGAMRKPEERSATFRVRAIVPLEGAAADASLMPDFPGLTDADNCRDWDTGFALKMDHIRTKDEQYWDQHRGTPKGFISLAAGQKIWSNRFGSLTALRFPDGTNPDAIARSILSSLAPDEVGLAFQPVRTEALLASTQGQDFGQLFLGFSFFLITAALLLTAMMFQLGIEQRTSEVGTLLALGLTARQVRGIFLGEAVGLAVLGSVLGAWGGIVYARAMLHGLGTIWRAAVGTSGLQYEAQPATLAAGAAGGAAMAVLGIWLALRKQARQPAHQLLSGEFELTPGSASRRSVPWVSLILIGLGCGLGAYSILGSDEPAPGLFFGAGSLILMGGLAGVSAFLNGLGSPGRRSGLPELGGVARRGPPGLAQLGIRSSSRRRKRSLATIGLLACGSFLIAAIGVFRLETSSVGAERGSGTGGFAFIGESSLPVVHDLNAAAGWEYFGLNSNVLANVSIVPLRVRDGEDASCLNLNRAQRPRLVGVRSEELASRKAFSFGRALGPLEEGWSLLKKASTEDEVAAIGDQASIQWALGKKVGDSIDYTDERGRTFKVRIVGALANSMLQGMLIIDETEFVRRFPNEEGYRMFLIDAPSNRLDEVAGALSRGLQDAGLELSRATDRLAAFNAVQNTYLSTFQVLGGLGLLLGSAGLAVVVLRNVLERRGELAVMLALGFRRRAIRYMLLAEHGALLVLGLGVGIVAAAVAVLPAVLAPGREVPVQSLVLTLAAVLLSGIVWTWLATVVALRGKLIEALRNH